MTSNPTEHHRSIKYHIHDYALISEGFVVTPTPDGRRIEVTGICPSCGGRTATTWIYGSGNGYKGTFSFRKRPTVPVGGPRTICCDCGHAHADRPDDAVFLGCGAYWQVELSQ
jgi:hypothetical protein